MADFNQEEAIAWHQRVMTGAQRIRDGITNDVINYYYDNAPSDESTQETACCGICEMRAKISTR